MSQVTDAMIPVVAPLSVEVGAGLVPLVEGESFPTAIAEVRRAIFEGLGVRVPGIKVRLDASLPERGYRISIKEVPVEEAALEEAATDVAPLLAHLGVAIRTNAFELIGIQEAADLVAAVEPHCPALVRETVPKTISLFQLRDVLRRLVEEDVSIRDLPSILECLAEWGQVEHDTVMLTEYVRAALKRATTHKYAEPDHTLKVLLVDEEIERLVRGAIQHTDKGSFLTLDPETTNAIVAAAAAHVDAEARVILTTMDLRRYVRNLFEPTLGLPVLSYYELQPKLTIVPVAKITAPPPA